MSTRNKLIIGAIIALLVIISSIIMALSVLKEEAVNNYLTISQLNAKASAKELNQDLNNIEQSISNIKTLLQTSTNKIDINEQLIHIQSNYPQIRSISILKNKNIIFSSNPYNINLHIHLNNLFPIPIFEKNVLQVSTPWIGRDFISGNDIYNHEESISTKEDYFIPIAKKININSQVYQVVINLNSDYFINRFLNNFNSPNIAFELIRLDGILLLSTNLSNHIGRKIVTSKLFNTTIETNETTGIENINGTKTISTYILTDDYPINLAVHLDYEQNLMSWNKKQYQFFVITTAIIILSIMFALFFFFLYHKKREKEIQLHKMQLQNQKKFKLLFEDSHFLAAVMNKEGQLLELNNSALEFLNTNNEAVINKKFWELNCFKQPQSKQIKQLITGYETGKIETEILAYDQNNQLRVIDSTISSIQVEDQIILIAMGLDITQKKEKEKRLKEAYTVFDNTRDGIMITNGQTQIINVNKAFEEITGYLENEVFMQQTNLLKSDIHTNHFYENMWNSLIENGYWEGEITNFNKNKEYFTEWLTINAIYDEKGTVVNYIGVFSDITEQKNREKILKEKDEVLYQQSKMAAMGEMIGNIAHQWRQPLSIISTAATSIIVQKSIGVSTNEEEIETLNAINKSSQYLSKTIDDFRNFLKADKELTLFYIDKAIDEALSLSSFKMKHAQIHTVLCLQSLKAYGVKNEFIQVIINILNNAKDALKNTKEKEKYIFIDVYSKEQYIYIDIKDNAGGIPLKIIKRVFEPYFTTKHQSQGTGIGLYMSEEIIKNHMQGVLYAHNETYTYKDHSYTGACLTIKLPLK